MPSSTSNSRCSALLYAKSLVAMCLALVLGLEIAAHYLLRRNSETFARVSRQFAQAVQVRPAGPGEPSAVLLVGNSLLMEGIDMNRLQELTSSQIRISPLFLEATGYYDWLYGLRRLFREGARPDVVIVGVDVESFLTNAVRLDYAPMMLFDARDVRGAAADLRLDHTATSNLLLAHSSEFWDIRSVIRAQILRRLVPRSRELFALLKVRAPLALDPELEAKAIFRLQTLRELCAAHGARLILLIPPTPSSRNAVHLLTSASQRVGVDSLVPIDPATLSDTFYQADAIHLNSDGAALFTAALATELPRQIQSSRP